MGKNKIWIELIRQNNCGYYVGGDIVYGKIHLNCLEPFACQRILLKVKGKESVDFLDTVVVRNRHNNQTTVKIERFKDEKVFFDQTLVPYTTPGSIPPGQYEYPFEYQLPNDLPGCLKIEGGSNLDASKYKAKVEYKLIATIDVICKSDLRSKVKLVINEKYNDALKPASGHDSKKFLTGGKLRCDLELNKNAYFAGENVLARLIANSNSTKETRKLKCIVSHTIELSAHGHTKRLKFIESRADRSGFEPCFYGVKYLQFPIPYNIPPTVNSPHISSEYKIVVTCDIPNAIDLDVKVPILILAPQFLYSTTPPVPPNMPLPPDVSFRPPWDTTSESCNNCGKKFKLLRRGHHCRHCGKLFCDKCLPKECKMPNLGYKTSERVCNDCYPEAQEGGRIYQDVQGSF